MRLFSKYENCISECIIVVDCFVHRWYEFVIVVVVNVGDTKNAPENSAGGLINNVNISPMKNVIIHHAVNALLQRTW